jgi:translation elongation factor EF-1alpha
MAVECIYISEQVLRFKITAGQKEMMMEKVLVKKTNQWKITKMNFQMVQFLPISPLKGYNVDEKSKSMPWYKRPP